MLYVECEKREGGTDQRKIEYLGELSTEDEKYETTTLIEEEEEPCLGGACRTDDEGSRLPVHQRIGRMGHICAGRIDASSFSGFAPLQGFHGQQPVKRQPTGQQTQ